MTITDRAIKSGRSFSLTNKTAAATNKKSVKIAEMFNDYPWQKPFPLIIKRTKL
jgi:hypothetical protein